MATNTFDVSQVQGTAWLKQSDGLRLELVEGMQLAHGAVLETELDAWVQLAQAGTPVLTVGGGRSMELSAELMQSEADPQAHVLALGLHSLLQDAAGQSSLDHYLGGSNPLAAKTSVATEIVDFDVDIARDIVRALMDSST